MSALPADWKQIIELARASTGSVSKKLSQQSAEEVAQALIGVLTIALATGQMLEVSDLGNDEALSRARCPLRRRHSRGRAHSPAERVLTAAELELFAEVDALLAEAPESVGDLEAELMLLVAEHRPSRVDTVRPGAPARRNES